MISSPSVTLLALTLLAGSAAAQTAVSVSAGRLTVTTSNQPQDVRIEMKDGPGIARLYNFRGIPDGAAYFGLSAVTVNTGSAFDKVEFDIESAQSWDIRINTGAGPSDTIVKWNLRPSASPITASVTKSSVPGGIQLSSVDFDVDTQRAQLNLNTGNTTEVKTKVIADNPTNTLGINFNSRAIKAELDVVSAAQVLDVTARGNHAAPQSEVKYTIAAINGGQARLFTDLTLSGGDDKFEGTLNNPDGVNQVTGTVRGGSGNDFLHMLTDARATTLGLSMQGGNGSDFINFENKNALQLSTALRPSIIAGAGNDFLILTTDLIRGSGQPNDLQPIIDGGAGFDLYNAFGLIRNCEGRL